jgi:TfoX/Sxy family transcriptional regulator of competence genes
MAYDEALANRIREALAGEDRVDEIKMMGGLGFMIRGHMALGIVGDELMVRLGPAGHQRALRRVHAREMDIIGRSTKGFVFVESAGIRTKRSLASWVAPAAALAKSLPPNVKRKERVRHVGS